jgi:adenine-specific DNA-methyltransferase
VVIGNPPYVRIKNIGNANSVKNLAFSSHGMTDMYIAFFDIGIQMLNKTGKLCFITPNSYFNSSAGKVMREYIINNSLLTGIKNFGHKQVFDNATTYCCITVLDKTNKLRVVEFEEVDNSTRLLDYNAFYIKNGFYFTNNCEFSNIAHYSGSSVCSVKNGCATLLDRFFIDSEIARGTAFSIPIVKASTGKECLCFYPYNKNGDIIDFGIIKDIEPHTAKLLEDNRESLEKRTIDKGGAWYGFGRAQAICDTYKKKFAINSLYKTVSDVHIYPCEPGCAVYGGLYILTELSESELSAILQAQEYIDYVTSIGKYKSGGYYTISSKEVEKFINYYANKKNSTAHHLR